MEPSSAVAVSPLRRLLGGLTLALVSLTLTLAALELGVRLLHLAPPNASPGWFWRVPDPETGWALQPGASGRWFNPFYEYDVPVTINRLGLRDVERPSPAKPPGVFRVLLLGDSYVEGLRVPLEATFGKVLEAQLNASAPVGLRFEVVPAGVSGWGTDQALLWYRRYGRAYAADLVVLAFFPGNDFQNNAEALEVANMGSVQKPFFALEGGALTLRYHPFDPAAVPPPPEDVAQTAGQPAEDLVTPTADRLYALSALYRFLAPRLAAASPRLARSGLLPARFAPKTLPPDVYPVAYGVYRRPPTAEWEEAFALTEALVRELQREVAADGAGFAVVALTAPEQVYERRWQRTIAQTPAMQPLAWDLEQPNRVIRSICQAAGIPYLDLLPIFRQRAAADRRPLHLTHDGHWTPAGEALAGEAIYQFLTAERLAPAQGP